MNAPTNSGVDTYLKEGCGRCPLGNTPDCKVNAWRKELKALRAIVLDCGLTEEVKWSVPCYTVNGGNVAMVSALKDYCALSFFKGALLKDPHGLLDKPGKNSQAARLMRFTNVEDITAKKSTIEAYIHQAINVERAGLKVEFKQNPEPIPDELKEKLKSNPALKVAFENLTPGRQRSYILHISAAKQSSTRISRIDKCIPKIFAGKGFHDR